MQKQTNIRWRQSDIEKVKREVKRFDAKINREIAKNPAMALLLPAKKYTKNVLENINTRKDLNSFYRSTENFFKKDATKILTFGEFQTTKYEHKEALTLTRRINKMRERELVEMNPTTDKGTMNAIEANHLKPKIYNPAKQSPGAAWRKFMESVEKQSRYGYTADKADLYKENYLKAVKNQLGEAGKGLYDKVKGIDSNTFYSAYYDDPLVQIEFIYDPLQQEIIADAAIAHWDNILYGIESENNDYEE